MYAKGPTIERFRGDDAPFQFTFTDSDGTAHDLTGSALRMSLNSEKKPADKSKQIFDIDGTIVNATGGLAKFTPTAAQMDLHPGQYWYDIERVLSGVTLTWFKGIVSVTQDISKAGSP